MATTGKTCNVLLILLPTFGLLLTSCMASNVLQTTQVLGGGQSLTYANYRFTMQFDCNLVLYDGNRAVWASGTNGRGNGCQCVMQRDGNLVVYNDRGTPVWASGTNRNNGNYYLILQQDRNVVIYDPSNGNAIWATGTNVAGTKPANIVPYTAKLNNVTATPAKNTVTTGRKITSNGKSVTLP